MNEKRIVCVALALLLLCAVLVSCTTPNEGEETADQTVWLGMNNEFPEPQSLDVGENKRVKVIKVKVWAIAHTLPSRLNW